MPLDHGYGVAIGTFASFTREDPSDGWVTIWQVKFNTQTLTTDDNGLPA